MAETPKYGTAKSGGRLPFGLMESLGFHHLALQARDVPRVASFYETVLGLPKVATHRTPEGAIRSIWLSLTASGDPRGGFLAVEQGGGDPGPTGYSMLGLRISATARAKVRAELEAQGVKIEKESRWTMYVKDPEGNLVGLSHHPNDLAE